MKWDSWLNLVIAAVSNQPVVFEADYCNERFNSIFSACGSASDQSGAWVMGGEVEDEYFKIYMTGGCQISGYLVNFPLTDMNPGGYWTK